MTDVIVHHLTTDQKGLVKKILIIYNFVFLVIVKVKCRELVRKIATYKTTLAVSLSHSNLLM